MNLFPANNSWAILIWATIITFGAVLIGWWLRRQFKKRR